jgi:cytochrome c oxidase assembly factor CtaG
MRTLRLAVLFACSMAQPALAHGGGGFEGWSFEPPVVLPLLITLLAFGAGWLRLRRRAVRGGERVGRRARVFLLGWLALAGAVVSPLHHAGMRSFAAHMAEHELLMLVAAPLLVLGRPLPIMLWAFPASLRQRLGRWTVSGAVRRVRALALDPVMATLMQAGALWLWHAPALFERALASQGWHVAQHLSFLITALFFWSAVLPERARHPGVAVLCLFATSLVSGALGAMMAFAQSPWYGAYAGLGMAPFGLSPLEDQQLAGMLMWVPGGLVHAAAALLVMARLLQPTALANSAGGAHGHVR